MELISAAWTVGAGLIGVCLFIGMWFIGYFIISSMD